GDIIQLKVFRDVLSHRCIFRQLHQAIMVLRKGKFRFRTEHAFRGLAAYLGLLDLEVARQNRTDNGERHFQAIAHIGSTTDNLNGLGAVTDLTHAQLVGVRVSFDRDDFTHDYAGEFTRYRFKAIYFQPGHGDLVHQLLGTNARINPLTQPLFTEFHRSCLVLMPFMRLIRNPACAVLPFGLTKLTQKTQVVFEEHAQVFHAIAKHGQALNAQTKSKATIFLGINTAMLEHLRVHHAAAHDFQPLDTAIRFPTPLDIHFGRRLGEREIRWTKTHFQVPFEEHPQKFLHRTLQISKADVLLNQQAFNLVEHGGVGHVGIAAIDP